MPADTSGFRGKILLKAGTYSIADGLKIKAGGVVLAGEGQELGPQEWVLYKPRLSAFFGTPLETQLHELGVTTVVICGCDFPNSPRASIYAASNRDFRIVLVADAVSRTTDMGLQELGSIGVRLMNTADCLAWLTADTTGRPQRAVETQA